MLIRKAVFADKEQVKILYKELFAVSARMQPLFYQNAEIEEAFLDEIIKSDNKVLFVAEENSDIAGFALALEEKTQPFACARQLSYAYLLDIIVRSDCRGRGIASGLVRRVKIWAKERNLHHVAITVLEENSRAIGCYKKEGFSDAMRTMRFIIDKK